MNNIVKILAIGTMVALPLHVMAAPAGSNAAARTSGGGIGAVGTPVGSGAVNTTPVIGGVGGVGTQPVNPVIGGTGIQPVNPIGGNTGAQPINPAPSPIPPVSGRPIAPSPTPPVGTQPIDPTRPPGILVPTAQGKHARMLAAMDNQGNRDGYVTNNERRAWRAARRAAKR